MLYNIEKNCAQPYPEVVNYPYHNCIVHLVHKLAPFTFGLYETNKFCHPIHVYARNEQYIYVDIDRCRSLSISFIGLMKIVNRIILHG